MAEIATDKIHSKTTPRKLSKYGSEVNELRKDLRKSFFQKLKDCRQHQVDNFRRSLSNEHLKKKFLSMVELKRRLYLEKEAKYSADQLLEEINLIENELLQHGAQIQADEYERQFEYMVNSFQKINDKCIVCDAPVVDNTLCAKCAQEFLTEDF